MAAALFSTLRALLLDKAKTQYVPRVLVGVITPYREQVICVSNTLKDALGSEAAKEATVETVDSFQGKQMDVVIFSCVRAASGVGFVADVRRMNVAITRARRALWIVGNMATLQANEAWAALIRCVIKFVCMRLFFSRVFIVACMFMYTQGCTAKGYGHTECTCEGPVSKVHAARSNASPGPLSRTLYTACCFRDDNLND